MPNTNSTQRRLFSVLLTVLVMMMPLAAIAQQKHQDNKQRKFSPEQFEQKLQDFITTEAHLSAEEAAKFFPLYKEMRQKQHQLMKSQRYDKRQKALSEEECRQRISDRDDTELKQKRIQKDYHRRFLEVLPATKVYDIIQAEDRFHRHMLREMRDKSK